GTGGREVRGVNGGEEEKKRQAKGGAKEMEAGVVSAARRFDFRAYRVTNDALVDKTVGELEGQPRDFRVFVLRIRRQGTLIEPELTTVIQRDDVVAVATRHEAHVEHGSKIGPEIEDQALLDIPIEVLDVVGT